MNRAVQYCQENAGAAAAAVGRQFGITQVEALRQMSTLTLLSGEAQQVQYIGVSGQPGALAGILKDTADMMVEQRMIQSAPDQSVFNEAIQPRFLAEALHLVEVPAE